MLARREGEPRVSWRSVRIEDGELFERAWCEVAHIVNMVALKQSRYAAALSWLGRNVQQQVTFPQRLVVDLQGRLVVAEPMEGSHDAGSQSEVAAMLIQDALPAQFTSTEVVYGVADPGVTGLP